MRARKNLKAKNVTLLFLTISLETSGREIEGPNFKAKRHTSWVDIFDAVNVTRQRKILRNVRMNCGRNF